MKVALIGASGNAGSRILQELVGRSHAVLAVARQADKIPALAGVTRRSVNAHDGAELAASIKDCDAVISALKFTGADTQSLIDAVGRSGVARYLVVGGAGSLEIAPGLLEMDSPNFPAYVKPEAAAGARFLAQLRASPLDWTFLSPSRFFQPGARTGVFRLGTDQLLTAADGKSAISFEDFAIALVDELEQPRHSRRRFTVGY
jgi:putative NADH-flavin reductase